MSEKETIRFPLRIKAEKNKEIDDVVHQLNMKTDKKVSKHQFIMDAIEDKIKEQKENYNATIS